MSAQHVMRERLVEWLRHWRFTCSCQPMELRAELGGRIECAHCGREVRRAEQR